VFSLQIFKTIAEMERVRDVPFNQDASVFVPIMGNPRAPHPTSTDSISRPLTVLARVREGVSIERVNMELAPILTRLRIRYPSIGPFTFRSLSSVVASTLPAQLAVLAAAVGILVAVACANVANLVLARVEGRRRELAVCRAIGSSTSRIIGGVVAESLVIAATGGMLGVLFAWQSIALMKVLTSGVLEADAVRLDFQVLTFAAAIILVTGVLVGLGPALRYAITDPGRILQRPASAPGARTGVPFSSLLVVAQVALAVVLVVAGALLARAFERSVSVKPAFGTEGGLDRRNIPRPRRLFLLARRIDALLCGSPGAAIEPARCGTRRPGLDSPRR
jgi:putative ABC transport system permease protein